MNATRPSFARTRNDHHRSRDDVPADLAVALAAMPVARDFFNSLSNSIQRMHIDNVNGTRNPDTRQRGIDKCVALFLNGKPR